MPSRTLLRLLIILSGRPSLSPTQPRSPVLNTTFTHQSQSISVNQWFPLFTLLLAPLVTHIAFGHPTHVIPRSVPAPHWTDQLVHFNPISILWRDYAIAHRRCVARAWDAKDLLCSSAVYWDGSRCDGSVGFMSRARAWIPDPQGSISSHTPLISGSSLATLAMTLQGIQAAIITVGGYVPSAEMHFPDGLPYVFVPLALLGLLRLQAAFWLSNEYAFDFCCEEASEDVDEEEESVEGRLLDSRCVKAVLFKMWWVGSVVLVFGLCIVTLLVHFSAWQRLKMLSMSSTELAWDLMYLLLAGGALIIHCSYVLMGHGSSTVVPCIQAWLYKAYTFLLILSAISCVVLGALETKILPGGSYSTIAPLVS